MNSLHTETRGRFRWLRTVECDDGVTIRTARAELATGLVVERVDGAAAPLVFITEPGGDEIELTPEQSAELAAALAELPAPDRPNPAPECRGAPRSSGPAWKPQRSAAVRTPDRWEPDPGSQRSP